MSNFKDLLAQSVQSNRHFYYGELMRRSKELLVLPKGNNSRKFRRFLQEVLVPAPIPSFEKAFQGKSAETVLVFPALLLDSEMDTSITEIPQIAQESLQAFLRCFHKNRVFDHRLVFEDNKFYAETAEMTAHLVTSYDTVSALNTNVFTFGVFYGFKQVDLATASQSELRSMVHTIAHIVDLLHAVTEDLPRSMANRIFSEGPFFVTEDDLQAYGYQQAEMARRREELFFNNLDKFLSAAKSSR